MNEENNLLGSIVSYKNYVKYLINHSRRETFEEAVNRLMNMHLDRFPKLSRDIIKAFQKVHELKVMPSMRSLQFGGEAILKNHARLYNCSTTAIDNTKAFSEVMFLLLSGVGVGFSVQKRHINKLPVIRYPKEEGIYLIHDSIQGWSEAVNTLMDAYFFSKIRPVFDYSRIRPKGAYLVTTGAKAPGPDPLKRALELVEVKLKNSLNRKLRSIEVHDILCIISDSVISGGVRRSATISLFDKDDTEMLNCKKGEWWNSAPWRARANNSAVLERNKTTKAEFFSVFEACQESGSGEPGFFWTNNADEYLTNPCAEISLRSNGFCNLTTINQTGITSEKDFFNRVYAATLIGTLQATYTDFHYLQEGWRKTTEEDALLGISFTGIADAAGVITPQLLQKGANLVLEVNDKYAKKLGINIAARTTTVKPEGSSSCVLGSSSGIHSRHSAYYIRRIRMSKNDAIGVYLSHAMPELVEDDIMAPNTVIISIPQKSPEGSLLRNSETALSLLNRALMYNQNWISPGHRTGDNQHNVSVTISVKDHEWDSLKLEMWKNRELYSGISLLPFDNSTYKQMPFEEISEDEFNKLQAFVKPIDLKEIREEEDNTDRMTQLACAGGACDIV
jgi:ribonucleoside-triphosphate reductase (thioredoxin)